MRLGIDNDRKFAIDYESSLDIQPGSLISISGHRRDLKKRREKDSTTKNKNNKTNMLQYYYFTVTNCSI